MRLQATLPPQSIRDVDNEIRKVKQEKESVVKSQEFEKAAQIRDREEKLRLEKQRLEQEWGEKKKADADKGYQSNRSRHRAHRQLVDARFRSPGSRKPKPTKLLGMEEQLHKRIVGQDPAVERRHAGDPPFARRAQEPEAPDRLVHLPRPDRRREDRSRA